MKRIGTLLLILTGLVPVLRAQEFNQDPANPNLDFALKDFTYWNIGWGPRSDPDSASGEQPGADSHNIVELYGSNWDGSAGTGKLPRVPSGLSRVGQMGATAGGGYGSPRAYSMQYNIKVSKEYPVLFFQLASIMDKTHYNDQNTHYKFSIRNSSGAYLMPVPCGGVELYPKGTASTAVVNTATIPAFGFDLLPEVGGIVYQPWQSVALDLAAFAGQTISFQLEHYDCYSGYHGSYDYIAAGMRQRFDTFYFCKGAASTVIKPYLPRFKSYSWNTGAVTDSIIVAHPVNGSEFQCTVSSFNNCTVTFQYVLVEVNTVADFATLPGSTCRELIFSDQSFTSKGSVVAWHWEFDDPASGSTNNTSEEQNPLHNFSKEGRYTVRLTVTNSEGCTASKEIQVEVQEAEVWAGFVFEAGEQCREVVFTDTSSTTKGSVNSWSWDFSDPASGAGDTDAGRKVRHVFSSSGPYRVKLRVGTDIGCSKEIEMPVDVPGKTGLQVSVPDVCLRDSMRCSAGSSLARDLEWRFSNHVLLQGADVQLLFTEPGRHTVSLSYTGTNGCRDSNRYTFTVFPLPEPAIMAFPAAAPHTQPDIRLEAVPDKARSYEWQLGDGTTASGKDVLHRYPAHSAVYRVVLRVVDSNACADTVSSTVSIVPPDLLLPNAFTPDGDGNNDLFRIMNPSNQTLDEFSIFSRYGECLYTSTDLYGGWNGTYKQSAVELGTYFYLLRYHTGTGEEKIVKGDVLLLR